MYIQSLRLDHFKNHPHLQLSFPERITLISGKNGSGKTNLLDGIHHLGLLRSAFHREDGLNILFGESFYRLEAKLEESGKVHSLVVLCEKDKKKQVLLNGKNLERMSDHLGKVPLVIILPDDPFQMNESAEWRRSFVDNMFSQSSPEYAGILSRFKKLLNQRNAMLRYFLDGHRFDSLLLDSLDEELAKASDLLFKWRSQWLPELNAILQAEYVLLSDQQEIVEIQYESQLADVPALDLLQSRRHHDLEAGRTSSGLQRDDFQYLMNGFPLRKFGSQGQQKSFLLAMKLSQYQFIARELGKKPCLLLDDVFDKLDEGRIRKLISRISEPDIGQVFISDAREERSRYLLKNVSCNLISTADFQV